MSKIGIALLGCGTVGGGTAKILTQDIESICKRSGLDLELSYVVDVNFSHAESIGIPSNLFETDYQKVLKDPLVKIVVELVGGTTIAKSFVEQALKSGKHVVTANKALLAIYGKELFALARANDVTIGFEASCAGGIPIIKALTEGLIANRIDALFGIVNGTCNFILSEMTQKGQSYEEALKEAQELGLAEADPTLDVSGMDSAHKIAIMGALSFAGSVELDQIPVEGIDNLDLLDLKVGTELGYIMKLIAVAQRMENGISFRVRPAFIGKNHPLAWIKGPFNAVSVYGSSVGHTLYYGRGAGASPTASAVASDIVSVASGVSDIVFNQYNFWPDLTDKAVQLPNSEIKSRYYLRFNIADKVGAVAQITTILGNNGISISSALQKELTETSKQEYAVPLVMTTHLAKEEDVTKAIALINASDVTLANTICISIVDEHPETIS
ncbi:homoserine dehydrogenase [Spirochaeta cellobiosiphila]|uniref:homoserine dehydrogenase n=1 Tax=Spirochaeta cellobiosiphila TaxID=504483 RepID=UPI0003FEB93C|nr:homoserine dehydrogenase [Spirochaeta cellobiosiphila]